MDSKSPYPNFPSNIFLQIFSLQNLSSPTNILTWRSDTIIDYHSISDRGDSTGKLQIKKDQAGFFPPSPRPKHHIAHFLTFHMVIRSLPYGSSSLPVEPGYMLYGYIPLVLPDVPLYSAHLFLRHGQFPEHHTPI